MKLSELVNSIVTPSIEDDLTTVPSVNDLRPAYDLSIPSNPRKRRSDHFRVEKQTKKKKEQWIRVVLILFLVFLTFQLLLTTVVTFIQRSIPTPNTDKYFEEPTDSLGDFIEDTVPFMQDWYRKQQTSTNASLSTFSTTKLYSNGVLPEISNYESNDSQLCIDRYFEAIKETIPTTSPSYVRLILQNFGEQFQKSPHIQMILYSLLTEPQDLHPLYEQSQECVGENIPLTALVCASNNFLDPPDLADFETRVIAGYLVNFAAVLETLTKHIEKSLGGFKWMVDSMVSSRRRDMEMHFEKLDWNKKEFMYAKYLSVAAGAEKYLDLKSKGTTTFLETNARASAFEKSGLVQLNILEAVKLDILNGREANARVGIKLATNCDTGLSVESNDILTQLDKDWIDAYIAWNTAFVLPSFDASTSLLGTSKLVIPAVSCTRDADTASRFLQRRVISLSLSLMHWFELPKWSEGRNSTSSNTTDSPPPDQSTTYIPQREAIVLKKFFDDSSSISTDRADGESYVGALGESNLRHAAQGDPDPDTVWKMLYYLCGENCNGPSWRMTDSSPITSILSEEEDFYIYLGFVNWLTIVMTGIGFEIFMVLFYLKHGWTSIHDTQWIIAQFLFSVLALTTLGLASLRNYAAIITLVVGLWKFGFPETVLPLYCAIWSNMFDKRKAFCLALDSVGTLLHHSAASLLICMLLSGTLVADRYVIDPILILCIQHWLILVPQIFTRVYERRIYDFFQICLEIWFEWTVFSNFEHYHWTAQLAAIEMVVAHWIWFVSGIVTMTMVRKVSVLPCEKDGTIGV